MDVGDGDNFHLNGNAYPELLINQDHDGKACKVDRRQEEKVVWETNQQTSHNCQSSSPTVITIASFPSAIVITIALHRFYRCHQQYQYQRCPGHNHHHIGPVAKLKIRVLWKICL